VGKASLLDRFDDPEMFRKPFDYYALLRSQEGVFFSKALNAYVVSRQADIEALLQNPQLFTNTPATDQTSAMAAYADRYYAMYDEADLPRRIPVLAMTDGDLHRRYRDLISSRFTPSAVKRMDKALTEVADGLIDSFIERGAENAGKVDLYREYALLVPLHFFCDTLGISRSHTALMQDAGAAAIALVTGGLLDEDGRIAAHGKLIEFGKLIQSQVQRVRQEPDESLLSHMVHSRTRDGDRLSEQEIISMCATLNTGGNETTTNGLGNTLHAALRDPDTLRRLDQQRDLIPRFIEEVIRTDSPIAAATRWVSEDAVVGGTSIPKGSCLHVRLAAGNRDEHKYSCAQDIDLQRPAVRNHLGFGVGIHYCVGVHLSRSEIRIGLERLMDRLDDLRIDQAAGPVEYTSAGVVRGLKALPVTFRKSPE
jgi:cytochrome P450